MKKRQVIRLSDGKVYESIAEAARSVGVTPRAICQVCEGICKTAGGERWAYADEVET